MSDKPRLEFHPWNDDPNDLTTWVDGYQVKAAIQRLEARIQKLREALKDIHANCKSPDCYFEECKTAKEALQADDEDSKR